MKNILLLASLFFIQNSLAVAPYGIKGQKQTGTLYSNVHVFPENQVSNLGGINALVETGNKNILVNANFEASPDFSGHTNSGSGAFIMETSASGILEGNKTGKFQCAPTSVCSSSQTQAIKAGQANLPAMISIVAEANGEAVEFCAIVDSVEKGCIPVTNKGNYKIPVITGTTNLGYILRQKSTASPLTIRYDQVKAEIKDTTELAPVIGPLKNAGTLTITATTTNPTKGAVSRDVVQYAQIGSLGRFIYSYKQTSAGSGGSGDYLFSLPDGITFDPGNTPFYTATSGSTANLSSYSIGSARVSSSVDGWGAIIPYDSTRFRVHIVWSSATSSGSTNSSFVSSGFFATGNAAQVYAFDFIAPVAQYASSVPVYYDRCKDPRNCETVVSFNSSTTAVVSETNDWINGNGTVSSSVYQFPLNTGVASSKMVCAASIDQNIASNRCATVTHDTVNNRIEVRLTACDSSGIGLRTDAPFSVICQRQGQDYLNAKVNQIVGSFKDYVKTPNTATGKVGFCSAKISATGVISDHLGGCFASCTNATTPVCTFTSNYWRSGSVPNCWAQGSTSNANNVSLIQDTSFISTTSYGAPFVQLSTGTLDVGARKYFCHGEIQ